MGVETLKTWGTTRRRRWIVEIFVFANLLILALDVWLAHSFNNFAHPAEWVPVIFSATVPWALIPGIWSGSWDESIYNYVGQAVGILAVAVGTAGLLYHLESGFFHKQTLRHLVYSAPFIAPVSYTGIGLLLVLNRMTDEASWGRWILLMALAGFVGNFGLSLLDHAQNAFFYWTETIPVVSAAYACGFLLVSMFSDSRRLHWVTGAVMIVQILVGLIGAALHIEANLHGVEPTIFRRFIYGAPVMAPLLFPNIALLGILGLWEEIDDETIEGEA